MGYMIDMKRRSFLQACGAALIPLAFGIKFGLTNSDIIFTAPEDGVYKLSATGGRLIFIATPKVNRIWFSNIGDCEKYD